MLCTVLARLLTPAIFSMVHSECWYASAPLAANLSANSLPQTSIMAGALTTAIAPSQGSWLLDPLRTGAPPHPNTGAKGHSTGPLGAPFLSGPWLRGAPQLQRRSAGVAGERASRPAEEHDQTIFLRPFLQRNARVVFHRESGLVGGGVCGEGGRKGRWREKEGRGREEREVVVVVVVVVVRTDDS